MKQIYKTLKSLRKKNGYTQAQIAEILNLDESSYNKIENGNTDINLSKLELISDLYKMSVVELLALPDKIQIAGSTLKPKISVTFDVDTDNEADVIKEALQRVKGLKVRIHK